MTEREDTELSGESNSEWETRWRILASILADALLILGFALIAWCLKSAVSYFKIEDKLDKLIFDIIVVGTGILTISTVVFQLVEDVIKAFIQFIVRVYKLYLEAKQELERVRNDHQIVSRRERNTEQEDRYDESS